MIIKEYRVVLPLTVEEYQAAQLFSVAEASKNETGGGEGIEILKNEPYNENGEQGQYTHKIYHLESRVPGFVKYIFPKSSLEMDEKAWNAYPKCKTVLTNNYLGKKFEISIETLHLPDTGTTENAHGLSREEWKEVEVVNIDIANDSISSGDYSEDLDPKLVRSERADRGPLGEDWIEEARVKLAENKGKPEKVPVMCAYKLVRCNFKVWGLQGNVERLIHRQEKRLFTTFHRQVYSWMDKWYGMTMEDIRKLEEQTKEELEQMIKQGEIRGTQVTS